MGVDLLLVFWEVIKKFTVTIITMKEAWLAAGGLAILAMYKWKVTFERRL